MDLRITQDWLEESSGSAIEEFKSLLVEILNNSPEDRHVDARWSATKTFEGNVSQLFYDERVIATLTTDSGDLTIKTEDADIPRLDELLFSVRFAAERLSFAVFSNEHGGAYLPQSFTLSLDHSFFQRNKPMRDFFSKSDFIPRYSVLSLERQDDGRRVAVVRPPFYAENKNDGSIHILNNKMLDFLITKSNQETNREFSYKVADSMNDFAKKYDFDLVPTKFYQNYGYSTKIVNLTHFDVFHIKRKVFISPYVWDFDSQHEQKYFQNVKNGMHSLDKVRKGETLDQALKRVVKHNLRVADDYVGAKVWGIEFDRDKNGILTPRLKINVFVHGILEKHQSDDHDWVSLD